VRRTRCLTTTSKFNLYLPPIRTKQWQVHHFKLVPARCTGRRSSQASVQHPGEEMQPKLIFLKGIYIQVFQLLPRVLIPAHCGWNGLRYDRWPTQPQPYRRLCSKFCQNKNEATAPNSSNLSHTNISIFNPISGRLNGRYRFTLSEGSNTDKTLIFFRHDAYIHIKRKKHTRRRCVITSYSLQCGCRLTKNRLHTLGHGLASTVPVLMTRPREGRACKYNLIFPEAQSPQQQQLPGQIMIQRAWGGRESLKDLRTKV